jgi:methylenetetrahydrofolate reductase (NADPH)
MRIADLFPLRRPLFSIELYPPKTPAGVASLKDKLNEIAAHRPDYISVTYGAGGGTRHTTREICAHIKQRLGIETMAHLTCVAHSRGEIGEVLAGLREEGIENIMALRGDPPKGEERFQPPPDGFTYAIELVRAIRALDDFGIGVAGYPEGHVEAPGYEVSLRHQIEKIEAGADFVVSQLFMDNALFLRWRDDLRRAGVRVPIVPGILPALSARQITGFAATCGARVPDALRVGLERFEEHPESAAAFGLVYALRQIEALLDEDVDGIHLYALNRLESIRAVSALVASRQPQADSAPLARGESRR